MARRSAAIRRRQRWLDYPLQGAVAWLFFGLFRMLPVDWASALGGRIARAVGPRLGASRKVLRNLERALPELGEAERRRILAGMWDNLGRMIGEYPHVRRLAKDPGRVEVVGTENAETARRSGAAILFSGHFANWELLPATAEALGVPLTLVYRRPNNPIVGRLLDRARHQGAGTLVPKGRGGAKALVDALRRGAGVALLVDQKMNDGLPIPFFGREAMTAPAVAQLALRFDAPLIPVRLERLHGTRFRITIQPPMTLPSGGDRHAAVRTVLTDVNRLLETWIRERPDQWLWLHRRWPD